MTLDDGVKGDSPMKTITRYALARYLQIESKIRALIRFDLASQIPLVE